MSCEEVSRGPPKTLISSSTRLSFLQHQFNLHQGKGLSSSHKALLHCLSSCRASDGQCAVHACSSLARGTQGLLVSRPPQKGL